MKLNFSIFKKGKPIYWIVGAIFLFVVFYLFASKGASASSETATTGVTTINAGPSDSQIQASLQMASISAQANVAALQAQNELAAAQDTNAAQVALAKLGLDATLAQIGAQSDQDILGYQLGVKQLDVEQNTQLAYLDAQKQALEIQSEYSLATAKVASETALSQQAINAQMFSDQLQTNQAMYEIQSQNLLYSNLIGQVGSLKKKDRDETLQIIAGQVSGNPVSYYNANGPAVITRYTTALPANTTVQ